MEALVLVWAGTLLATAGYGMHFYLLAKYRTANAPGLAPRWRAPRPRRDWFISERAYRLHDMARWMMFFGGFISLAGGLLLYRS